MTDTQAQTARTALLAEADRLRAEGRELAARLAESVADRMI